MIQWWSHDRVVVQLRVGLSFVFPAALWTHALMPGSGCHDGASSYQRERETEKERDHLYVSDRITMFVKGAL